MNRLRNFLLNRRTLGRRLVATAAPLIAACACGRAHAQPVQHHGGSPATGEENSLRSRVLGAGAAALQTKAPLNAMNMYLNGFHFYADDMGRPVEAHHFCTHLTEDLHQCVIFDGNSEDSRLIGIEYIVSERVFRTLPEDEKKLWHSHDYETTSGELVMPGLPDAAENAAMRDLSTTYGKTWHTWQVDRGDTLPLGPPQLMMAYTAEGQLPARHIEQRDQRLGVSKEQSKQSRKDIPVPTVVEGANSWQSGQVPQLSLQAVPLRNRR
ncbi:OBAP family protein [Teichococcus vastitatis]|jgi:hypothetical protein|uniref:OBAP family protein n=1 Tax=Teichococcus vastitatis TaxID=2307076 RepID=A0ABS9VZT5_9PROT|nr:OBAP family protein [Pseudoroseomonas vastitatis]MCI0752551.1 OBAP family protein [Pseudoroseomonas vastitatis]